MLAGRQGKVEGPRRFAEDRTTAGLPAAGAGLPHNAHVPGRLAERLTEEMPEGGVRQPVAPLEVRRLQGVGAPTFDVVEDRSIDAVAAAGVKEPQVQGLASDLPRVHQPRRPGNEPSVAPTFPLPGTARDGTRQAGGWPCRADRVPGEGRMPWARRRVGDTRGAPVTPEAAQPGSRRVVLLTRESDTTALVANFLAERFSELTTVVESPESRFRVARRRARRIGWVQVGGQLAFVLLVVSVLSHRRVPG